MKKQFGILLLSVLMIIAMTVSAASASMPRLVDDADLLADYEEAAILSMLDEVSERQEMDVVIVTADTLNGKSPMAYADDFFDYNGYGMGYSYDGVLLLVSMEDRDVYISTSGYGITAFTDAGIDWLQDAIIYDLSSGDYADAFEIFVLECDYYISQAKQGQPIDIADYEEAPDHGFRLLVAAVIGLIAALIVTGSMKGQLKTIAQQSAGAYVKNGSFQLTDSRELFLYRNVTRTVRQTESSGGGSSTHRSSSGRSHGGGGRKF